MTITLRNTYRWSPQNNFAQRESTFEILSTLVDLLYLFLFEIQTNQSQGFIHNHKTITLRIPNLNRKQENLKIYKTFLNIFTTFKKHFLT